MATLKKILKKSGIKSFDLKYCTHLNNGSDASGLQNPKYKYTVKVLLTAFTKEKVFIWL